MFMIMIMIMVVIIVVMMMMMMMMMRRLTRPKMSAGVPVPVSPDTVSARRNSNTSGSCSRREWRKGAASRPSGLKSCEREKLRTGRRGS
jgi:hypothetical protein